MTRRVFASARVQRGPANRGIAQRRLLPAAGPWRLQRSLVIGSSNDPFEHEADQIADQVMRMPVPAAPVLAREKRTIQRKCAACGEEDNEVARKESVGGARQDGMVAPEIVEETLASAGEPLSAATRDFFEPRFGRDFSHVRVHADDHAAVSAASIGARAYTVGPHVAFGAGGYAPATPQGRHLLAHELAHVAQADGSVGEDPVQRQDDGGTPGGAGPTGDSPTADGGSGDAPADGGQAGGNAGAAAGGGDGDSGDGGKGGIEITFPDVTLFDEFKECDNWPMKSEEVPIYTAHFDIPHIGPLDATLFVRGQADVNLCAVLGPGMLQNIKMDLNPLAGSYSGTAELSVPATLTGGLALTGVTGAHADYAGAVELVRGEGVLQGQGTAAATTTYTIAVKAEYSGGSFSFSVSDALTNCLALSLNETVGSDIFIIGCKGPCFTGRWTVGNWDWGRCFNVGAQLTYGPNGIGYEFAASEDVLDDLLVESLRNAMFSGGEQPCVPSEPPGGGQPATPPGVEPVEPPPVGPGPEGGGGVSPSTGGRPDLFRGGNATSPRMDNVRVPKDIPVDDQNLVHPNTGGVSTFEKPKPEKNWYKYPASTSAPSSISIINDSPQHWSWQPAMTMKLDDYKQKLASSHPNFTKIS